MDLDVDETLAKSSLLPMQDFVWEPQNKDVWSKIKHLLKYDYYAATVAGLSVTAMDGPVKGIMFGLKSFGTLGYITTVYASALYTASTLREKEDGWNVAIASVASGYSLYPYIRDKRVWAGVSVLAFLAWYSPFLHFDPGTNKIYPQGQTIMNEYYCTAFRSHTYTPDPRTS